LAATGDSLTCTDAHRYSIADGIAVLLDPEVEPTQEGYWATDVEVFPSEERRQPTGDDVDEYVRWLLRGTCGSLYDGARATRYPIPAFPLQGPGRLLDIGSNWGRWSLAAARRGFAPVALDPSLGAARAARRVARQLALPVDVVVGDARHLPFADASFDVVFSYSVLQHLSPDAVALAAAECGRVLRPGGVSLHQLPNRFGARSIYQLARRRFRNATGFEVRYWDPRELRRVFGRAVGPTTLAADGFMTLNPHPGRLRDLSIAGQVVVGVSRALTAAAGSVPPLQLAADSLWVTSERNA
jgi:SAM-dependent methyltransferase